MEFLWSTTFQSFLGILEPLNITLDISHKLLSYYARRIFFLMKLSCWKQLPLFLFSTKQVTTQLAQQRCDNVVTTSLLTLSQSCGMVENESCADVGFRRCDNVALQRYQDVATTLLQRRHNIKHWISRPFYYRVFWFLSLHRNVRELQKC